MENEEKWYKHSSMPIRLAYGGIFLVMLIFSWILRDELADHVLSKLQIWDNECSTVSCYGKSGVLRVSLALFTFFMIMCIAMIGHKEHDAKNIRTRLQDGLWIPKIMVLILLLVVSFLLPNTLLVVYGYMAIGGSAIFVFMQIVLLVNFAYAWNENWVEKEWYKQIIAVAIAIFLVSFIGIVLMYVWFAPGGCGLNIFFVTFTLLSSLIYSYMSIRDDVERGALLTSAVVTGFSTYMCFSALMSGAQGDCNKFSSGSPTQLWLLGIGLVIALISVAYNTMNAASVKGFFDLRAKSEEELKLLNEKHAEGCYNFSYFHFVFACGSMYFAMLLLDWNLTSMEVARMQVDVGTISMWVKIVSEWLTILLYGWSLAGPLLCPHRQWD